MELVEMYGDPAISQSWDDELTGLDMDEFHTYRFEMLDGRHYWISVDGTVFTSGFDVEGNDYHYLQFGGRGGCGGDWVPDAINEWDHVRYGKVTYGEQVVSTDPPTGYLDPIAYAHLDRFTVTFDQPNYVYIDEITVRVVGGAVDPPVITQVWRRDNDVPETIEIVLDRPIPIGYTTRFTLDDGVATNIIDYSPGKPIPATSAWSLVTLMLLTLTAGSLLFRTTRPAADTG